MSGRPDRNPTPATEATPMRHLMRTEPVLVLLNGAAAVVNVVLLAVVAVGAVHLDGGQIAAIVTAVQAVANLVGAVIRAAVVSPATAARRVAAARRGVR